MSADFLHQREYLNADDIVELDCDTQCNFMLTDDSGFASYKRGDGFTYYGGHFTHFPARIAAPHSGYWNVIIDLGGGEANIRYSVRFIKSSSP